MHSTLNERKEESTKTQTSMALKTVVIWQIYTITPQTYR